MIISIIDEKGKKKKKPPLSIKNVRRATRGDNAEADSFLCILQAKYWTVLITEDPNKQPKAVENIVIIQSVGGRNNHPIQTIASTKEMMQNIVKMMEN